MARLVSGAARSRVATLGLPGRAACRPPCGWLRLDEAPAVASPAARARGRVVCWGTGRASWGRGVGLRWWWSRGRGAAAQDDGVAGEAKKMAGQG